MSGYSDAFLAWTQRDAETQRVLVSGSVSGLRPVERLGYGYMTSLSPSVASVFARPYCGNAEGWGPLSPTRYDFTPCFLDTFVMGVSAFGILIGALAVVYLLKCRASSVDKDWHFWMKQSLLAGIIGISVAQFVMQAITYGKTWYTDFRIFTATANVIALSVAFAIQWLEHTRMRNPNGVVLLYWLFLLIVLIIKLRSLISQQVYIDSPTFFILYSINFALSVVEFLFEWLWPRKSSSYEALIDEEECPLEYANVFSVLTFGWMTPLMRYGYKEYLTEDDLWALAKSDNTKTTGDAFQKAWEKEVARGGRPNLWRAMWNAFGWYYALGAVFKVVNDVAQYIQPQLLRVLIAFVESHTNPEHEGEPIIKGVSVAVAMFTVAIMQSAMVHQYFQRAFVSGMRIKGGLTSAIYKKSLRLSNEGRASQTTGDIVNFMAVDAQRLQDLTQFGQMLWSAPLQITICMLSLYDLVGYSMFSGIAVMVVMLPINGYISRVMRNLQKSQMKIKDARSRLITEIINNMKSIKLYAWGTAFMNKLNHVRNDQELKNLRRIGATQAIANFTWNTAPFFVSCSTFATYVFTRDTPLTTDIVFPALSLFNLLNFPLAVLPMVITAIVEASVAVQRITDFLLTDELQEDAVIFSEPPTEIGEETVLIRDATFSWDRHTSEDKAVLQDIHYTAYKGELSCIVGRVGSGKSSFLSTLLGDIYKLKGTVEVRGNMAYVAQQPWILNASVKDNIIFGHRFDPEFYQQTVHACALVDDFVQLPDGDQTYVGERGISLSGGQKARLALARAVYARADIYLLDDVLSAVDSHVGKHIIDNVLGPHGLLASKTRILATNSIPVLKEASYITLICNNKIAERGTYKQLIAMKGLVSELLKTAGRDSNSSTANASETSTIAEGQPEANSKPNSEAGDDVTSLSNVPGIITSKGKGRSNSMQTLRRASHASFHGPRSKLSDEDDGAPARKSAQNKENSEKGSVKKDVYLEYARSNNWIAVTFYLSALILAQVVNIGGSFWLKKWAESNADNGYNAAVGRFITIYFIFGIGSSLLTMIQTLILWIFCSIEASRKLHEKMALAIFRAPMSFFDVTPAGRIMNRFSADIYKIDELLARTFNMLFVNGARSVFTLVIISVSSPRFSLLIVPLIYLYMYIQKYYLRTSRELKRLNSVSRSPIYAHFQETLGGVATIRAYGQQPRFTNENEWRVDANLRAFFPSISSNRWLALRLEFIGSLVILAAAGFPVLAIAEGRYVSSGMVGLSMAYALQIVSSLNWIVRQSVEVETNIVSVERVLEYASIKPEAPDIIPSSRPPAAWPTQASVEFHDYSARYREGLDLVLKNITLDIKPQEKIGVVGRTGAGKSSLTLALFRIIEAAEGHISMDGINTSTIGLLDLRRRLAIIPQDAALFEGSVRDNLDPGHVHQDNELWSVLEHARLKDHVLSMDGQLDAKIQEGGSNLSQGQRQLISLARAMLTPSNVLVLDEATAAVDVQTDALLQETLRSPLFSHKTIITVAHRINTIIDSDRVVVLDKGRVAEFGPPKELLKKEEGIFYSLVKQSGLLEEQKGEGSKTSRASE